MGFLTFLALLVIIYLLWRIMDQQPDVLFRVSEIQRDIAEIRRHMQDGAEGPADAPAAPSSSAPAAPAEPASGSEGTTGV